MPDNRYHIPTRGTNAAKARALRAQGLTPPEIAKALGMARQNVHDALKHLLPVGRPPVLPRCQHCGQPIRKRPSGTPKPEDTGTR